MKRRSIAVEDASVLVAGLVTASTADAHTRSAQARSRLPTAPGSALSGSRPTMGTPRFGSVSRALVDLSSTVGLRR
jgi:hypothetical protein